MKKILVPVDFSECSKTAALYAANLGLEINGALTLVTIINSNSSGHTLMNWRRLEREMIDAAHRDATTLIDDIRRDLNREIKIDYQYLTGYPVQERIEEFVKTHEIDLVVMGTRGASGIKKLLMGSNATAVINESSVPVITVPPGTQYRPIRKLLYATDKKNLRYEIGRVAVFARVLHASLDVLHVGEESGDGEKGYLLERELIDETHYANIQVHHSAGQNVVEKITDFAEKNRTDLLVMFTEKMSYLQEAFGKSNAREFAFKGKVPLLTLNKTAAEFAIMQRWQFDLNFK